MKRFVCPGGRGGEPVHPANPCVLGPAGTCRGQVLMQQFLDGFSFSQENPPNAAIEMLEGDEGGE